MVWAKMSSYSPWPARIATWAEILKYGPSNTKAPKGFDDMASVCTTRIQNGETFVCFYGTNDYAWVKRKSQVTPYDNGPQSQKNRKKKKTKSFLSALESADFHMSTSQRIRTSKQWIDFITLMDATRYADGKNSKDTKSRKRKKEKTSPEAISPEIPEAIREAKGRTGDGKAAKDRKEEPKVKKPRVSSGGKSAKASDPVDTSDAICFVCKLGGDLVLCDYPGCDRVYHAACLRLRTPPPDDETFFCPLHRCCACGIEENIALHMALPPKPRRSFYL